MTKIMQKNYEAIKIYRQKEKLFELKGKIQTLETENTKFKDLLKECREHLKYVVVCWENKKIVEKLDQVLGKE